MKAIHILMGIVWGLWFGGVIALFVFVTALFRAGRTQGAQAAPILFLTFERYHLVLAAVALIIVVVWRIMSKSRRAGIAFGMLVMPTLAAVLSAGVVTPRVMKLNTPGEPKSPEFEQAHRISGIVYSLEAISLLAAGIVILGAEEQIKAAQREQA